VVVGAAISHLFCARKREDFENLISEVAVPKLLWQEGSREI
jgi:hypothetical protein